jgi:hypothetical protein
LSQPSWIREEDDGSTNDEDVEGIGLSMLSAGQVVAAGLSLLGFDRLFSVVVFSSVPSRPKNYDDN